jgi:hypothetical protein
MKGIFKKKKKKKKKKGVSKQHGKTQMVAMAHITRLCGPLYKLEWL